MDIFGGVKDLFVYNRQNFGFNRGIDLERVYQIQKMRLEQVELYREDIRDLFDLTISKMDSYLVVNSLSLAFTMGFFYEGRLPENTPAWLMWLWALSLLSAVVFLVLSVWFALHASVTAQTFAVRILTQWLRLPIPSAADIRLAAPRLEDFERGAVKQLLRLPLVAPPDKESHAGTFSSSGAAAENATVRETLEKDYTDFIEHFRLFRDLQSNWTGFDAYARVTMVIGTFHLLYLIVYFALAHFLLAIKQVGALAFPLGMFAFCVVHLRHNIALTASQHIIVGGLLGLPPTLATISALCDINDKSSGVSQWLAPLCFAFHGIIATVFLFLGYESFCKLPTRFSTIVHVDLLHLEGAGDMANDVLGSPRLVNHRTSHRNSSEVMDRIPWYTYKIASCVIVAVWIISLCWATIALSGASLWRWDNDPVDANRMAFSHWRYNSSA